jgi:putative endonuclease
VKPGWVYILVGRTGTLYTGVTSDLYRRVFEHKNKVRPGFASKYDCTRLVYYESTDDIRRSIDREKQIKGWTRAKKLALVETLNPAWKDLAADWGKPFPMLNNPHPPRS